MKPETLLRHAFALALLLAVTGWGATALAQTAPFSAPQGFDRASGLQPDGVADMRVDPSPQTAPLRGGLSEGFDDITTLPAAGWAMQNSSSPVGLTSWFQGNPDVFPAHEGAPSAYIGANFNNTAGSGTISNWLMTPEMTLENGTEMSFWARASDAGWADRLQVRMSTNGSSTDVGTSATDVGDFTELLLDINPTYQDGVFINEWVEYTVTVSGVASPTSGRLAFRYFVESGGPSGNNSDFIGIDEVSVTSGGGGGDMTIAEARAAGPGTTVTVEGVVTRSKGAFTYFQDGTAGLTIRQTSGDFFDDVADGTITTGTRISVTGTLSEFRGLLQINQQNAEDNDLDSYSVVSQGNSVSAQTITLQELIDNGEDYEAELVRVTGLTVDAEGMFEPATGYDATDATATLEAGLRVPNAADSDVDGMDIPEGEFTFTGVIGQFTFDEPADNGYQLMAIEATDISVAGTPVDEAIHDNGLVQFEVYSTGNLGTEPAGPSSFPGTGFVFDGTLGLFTGSFVVGASPTQVSGNYYGGGAGTFEWVEVQGLTELAPPFGAPYENFDQAFEAVYDDSAAPNPIGLEVTQRSYSSTMAGYQGFVVVEFEVRNTSGEDLTGLYPGVFADWDVSASATNDFGGFDEETNLLYIYDDAGAVSTYFGVAALDRDEVEVSGVFYDALGSAEQDEDIYTYLTTLSDDPLLPDDRRPTLGVGPYDIAAGESVTVRFAFVGGADLNDIVANAEVAQGGAVSSEVTTPAGTYALYSAYPNPFAGTTTLGFTLPEAQQVRMTVYDLLGRRVATLVDGIVQAGDQQVRFDASNLPSGTYIVRLEAGSTNLTERVTVVR